MSRRIPISAALGASNYLPPNSGNAVDLIRHLSSIAPADSFAKEKLDQAVKAGYLPPRLYDRAVKREQLGWNVSLKILDGPETIADWDREE